MRCYICNTKIDAVGAIAVVVCNNCAEMAIAALATDAKITQRELRHTDPETGEVDMDAYWDEVEREERAALRYDECEERIRGEQFDDRLVLFLNEY